MEKVTDDDVTMMWFEQLVAAQRKYVELAGDLVGVGNADSHIQFSQFHIDEYKRLAKLLDKEIEVIDRPYRSIEDVYHEYSFTYEEFKVVCLVDYDWMKEKQNYD